MVSPGGAAILLKSQPRLVRGGAKTKQEEARVWRSRFFCFCASWEVTRAVGLQVERSHQAGVGIAGHAQTVISLEPQNGVAGHGPHLAVNRSVIISAAGQG